MSLDDEVKDLKPQQTVTATLIATVTFAGGFIVPGGYWAQGGPTPRLQFSGKMQLFKHLL